MAIRPLKKGAIISLQVIILSSVIVTAAFLIRGLTGFGSGLLMVPMLLLLFDLMGLSESIRLVVPTAASLAVLSGIVLLSTFRTWKRVRKDILLMMIAGVIIGMPLGTYVLASVESSLLKRLFGLFLMGYALKMLIGWKISGKEEPKNNMGLIAGFLGGCSGGMFGAGAPPVIIYLNRKIADKQAFRATLILYFLAANSWQCATLFYVGLINGDVLRFALYMLPAFVIGNVAGSILHVKINQVLFHRIIALVLLISGAFLMISKSSTQITGG